MAKQKTKVVAIEKMPHENNDGSVERYWLEVKRESETFITTSEVGFLGLRSQVPNQRIAKEIRWSKETGRPFPDDDTYEFYRIYQHLSFVPQMVTVLK